MGSVYVLCDPRDEHPIRRVRYVGVSVEPAVRLGQHHATPSRHLRRWLAELRKARREPELLAIEPCDWTGRGICPVEIKWISFYSAMGAPLLNVDRVPRLPAEVEAEDPPPPPPPPGDNVFTCDLGFGFGMRLKRRRRAVGMELAAVAEEARLAPEVLAAWEAGQGGGARVDQVFSVAMALRIYAGELLFGSDRRR